MFKTDDWFFAGLIAGIIGGVALNLYCLILILLGIPTGTYWEAMGGLFYNKQLLSTWLAQIHGFIDSVGVSGANGILTCLILKLTSQKYYYVKCVVMSAVGAYFLFLGVYPQTGLGKNNPITPWVALFGHTVFLGLLTGYVLKNIYSPKAPNDKLPLKQNLCPPRNPDEQNSKILNESWNPKKNRLVKPKKIKR